MALRTDNAIAKAMEHEIVRRYDLRGIIKDLTKADLRKVATTAAAIEELDRSRALSIMRAFMDYTLPVGNKSFRQIRNIYFEWRTWSAEVYPTIQHLLPVTTEDEEVLSFFFKDWKALRVDRQFYRTVYRRPGAIGGAKMAPAYRYTPDFFRVLTVLRHYQQDEQMEKYPLFTLRAYLAAQIEALSGFVTTLQIGNVVSEKAMLRFDEWYLYRFYSLELVKKGLKRPSDNNPVSNPAIRVEYERQRQAPVGDYAFDDEPAVPWGNCPARGFAWYDKDDDNNNEKIKLPPGMGDLLE